MSQGLERGSGKTRAPDKLRQGLRHKVETPVSTTKGENYAKDENTPRGCKTLQSDSFRKNLETFCRYKTLASTQSSEQKKKIVRYDRSF